MLLLIMMTSLWLNEASPGYNLPSGGAPAFLSPDERLRWERLRVTHALYKGHHRSYYLLEGRTQFDYPRERVQDREIQRYITYNLLRLVSVKSADLLFGSKAKLDAPSPAQTDRLDELARRSLVHTRFHESAVQASWAGGAFLESVLFMGEPYLEVVPADEMFPEGARRPDGQYERYTRYAIARVGPRDNPITLLLSTTYEPGLIRREVHQLDDQGRIERSGIDLAAWPAFARSGDVPPPEQRTGIAENTITYIANNVGGQEEVSDYDGLIELQDTVNAKFAQAARILAKHSDPKLAAPETAADARGNLSSQHDVYYFRTKDEIPQYITLPGDLAAAFQDREAAVDALCIAAEMSQVLLGIKKGATPDAARKLRLEATNTLAKVSRKSLAAEPSIARAVEVTQRLDQTSSLRRSYPVDPVGVEMRDGLPIDELDEANVISTLRGGQPSMSLEAAVERRVEDPDAAATEIERIRAERAAATPSVLFGEPGEMAGEETGEETGNRAGAGAAEANA